MHGGVRQVEEERLFTVGLDELHRFFRVLRGDGGIALHAVFNSGEIAYQGQRHLLAVHVVAVGDAKVVVKALACGHEIGMIAEVPFSDAHGGVTLRLENLRHGCLAGVQSFARGGKEDAQVLFIHVHVYTAWVTAGHEACA